jgi:O-acetyl-ADP-ribose deacetylase (regulator of RNase III)
MMTETEKVRLVLVDTDPKVCAAFSAYFGGLRGVEVVNGPFEELMAFDCVVMPSNSFGFVTGGVEAAIIRYFGEHLRDRIRNRIHDMFSGEQPVGTSLLIRTGDENHPFVAHTPLMRIPMPISLTDNVYSALWAVLNAVKAHNASGTDQKIRRIACPGFATTTGQVTPDEAARQMALAFRFFTETPDRTDWNLAFDRQEMLGCGGDSVMLSAKVPARKRVPKF